MADLKVRVSGGKLLRALPASLTVLLCLLTIVWMEPDFPFFGQDSGWPLALNQAVSDRLAFGRDILFNLGPWAAIYTGQYHPATDGMMVFGGAVIAFAFSGGLIALAQGGRRWVMLLAPILITTIGLRDPIFVALPMLLLAVAVSLAQPPSVTTSIPRTPRNIGALLMLTAACALLSFVKSTFGTQATLLMLLALLALVAGRPRWLAGLMLTCYLASLIGFWLAAGQRLSDLPGFFEAVPLLISGYTEGLAKSGAWTDIAAYLGGAVILLGLFWLDRTRRRSFENALLLLGLLFTLFVAFKSGFVRHDEHALIAAGSLAMLPFVLINMWRARTLAVTLVATLSVLAFISHHYPGYEWPSATRGETRLASAVEGAWTRVTNPARLRSHFDAAMARIKIALPLPHVAGPSDIYSSGQAILLANGLNWSPRPAIQSVTVTSVGVERADLSHLEGTDLGPPSVQNVFFTVEDVDHRLPSLQEGMSWPALLSQFRVFGYNRGQDMALLQRQPGASVAVPSGPILLKGDYRLGEDVSLPVLPDGLGWARLDIRPTLLGRLASFLLRPPALFITIHYADGPVERYRLLSDLARSGFMLTPRIRSTEGMLRLLLPDRRDPKYRPISVALSGESGTRWLWEPQFNLQLQTMVIPIQPQVRNALLTKPQPQTEPAWDQPMEMADFCAIDFIGEARAPAKSVDAQGDTRVSGSFVASITTPNPPEQFFVRLTDAAGQSWQAPAMPSYRPDVAGYFNNQALVRSGFDVKLDLSGFAGPYTLSLEAEQGAHRWQCKLRQDIFVGFPHGG